MADDEDVHDSTPDRQLSYDEWAAQLNASYSQDQLINDASATGLDLTNPVETLRCAAVGFATSLWRNTEVENCHAGDFEDYCRATNRTIDWGDPATEDLSAAYDAELQVFYDKDRQSLSSLRDIGDVHEAERLTHVATQSRLGFGIPDDVMMRMNVATTKQIFDILVSAVPLDRLDPLKPNDYWYLNRQDSYFDDIFKLVRRKRRDMAVGGSSLSPRDLMTPNSLTALLSDQQTKASKLWQLTLPLTQRRYLQVMAIFGASYSRNWWGHPWWESAISEFRSKVDSGAVVLPDGVENNCELWTAYVQCPNLVNGLQAEFLIHSTEFVLGIGDSQQRRVESTGGGAAIEGGPFKYMLVA